MKRIVYSFDRTGRPEIYVNSFPALDNEVSLSENGGLRRYAARSDTPSVRRHFLRCAADRTYARQAAIGVVVVRRPVEDSNRLSVATKKLFTYKDECVEKDPHVGFDAEASRAAHQAVGDFLSRLFGLAR